MGLTHTESHLPAFLVYTLLNLEKPSIPLNHPRVIVEAATRALRRERLKKE